MFFFFANLTFYRQERVKPSVWVELAHPTLDPDRCFLIRKFTQSVAPLGMAVVFFKEGYQQQLGALGLPYEEPRWSSLRSRVQGERALSGLLPAVRAGAQPLMRLGLVEHCVVVGAQYMRRCPASQVRMKPSEMRGSAWRAARRR